MRLPHHFIFTGLIALSFGMVACKKETPTGFVVATPTATPTVTGTPAVGNSSTSATASINAAVYLKIERQLQTPDDAVKTLVGTCQVPIGSPRGTVVTCNPTVGGSFSIPEGDLHYSKLIFTSGTNDPVQCAYLLFRPKILKM